MKHLFTSFPVTRFQKEHSLPVKKIYFWLLHQVAPKVWNIVARSTAYKRKAKRRFATTKVRVYPLQSGALTTPNWNKQLLTTKLTSVKASFIFRRWNLGAKLHLPTLFTYKSLIPSKKTIWCTNIRQCLLKQCIKYQRIYYFKNFNISLPIKQHGWKTNGAEKKLLIQNKWMVEETNWNFI